MSAPVPPFYGMSKAGYLQGLCYRFGDFKVAAATMQADGTPNWSRHISLLEAWNYPAFLEQVNNRTAFETELRFDLDPAKDETREQTDERFNKICDELGSRFVSYTGFFTGSRSYHIHIVVPELALYDNYQRRQVKSRLISKFGAELLKASDNTMMTLEFSPNNKTGKLKELVRGDATCPIE